MLNGWLKYGLNTDLIHEKSLNVKMTNVGGNSPVFQLNGKKCVCYQLHLRINNWAVYMQKSSCMWKTGKLYETQKTIEALQIQTKQVFHYRK